MRPAPEFWQAAKWAPWDAYDVEWTASSSNPAIGNGTLGAAYRREGSLCFLRGKIHMGTTTTFGSGEWRLSLPFDVLPSGRFSIGGVNDFQVGNTLMVCAGTTYSGFIWATSQDYMRLVVSASASVTSASPASWAANSSNWLSWSITIEMDSD